MIQRDVFMRRLPDNTLAMDTAILAAVSSYEVGFNLMPLPKKAEKAEPKQSPSSSYRGWYGRRNQQQPYGKGPGKAKASGQRAWSPRSSRVETMCPSTPMAGDCALTSTWGVAQKPQMVVNVTRDRGFHLCMRRGCHAPHPESEHPAKDKGTGKTSA